MLKLARSRSIFNGQFSQFALTEAIKRGNRGEATGQTKSALDAGTSPQAVLDALIAGMDDVPVLVRDVPDEAAAVMSLVENIQREDLNPLEEAQGLQRLIDEFRLTHDQAAQAVGRSRSAASNLMRLLNLTDPVQRLLLEGHLEMGHARALLALAAAEQILCANEIVSKRLSVRETERLVAKRSEGRVATSKVPRATEKSRDLLRIEEQLADHLTAPVQIRLKRRGADGGRGEIAISFGSLDELNGVLDKLGLTDR